ncbi:MAG: carboxymuconolactone decarboxylase family protein [Saprospiraceae bacterium]
MPWIKTIAYKDAVGKLKNLYEKIKGPNGYIDNVLTIHSLRPQSLSGHMALYKNVLHHPKNTLPKWYLETLGVYTSQLNKCSYCVEHHAAGLRRLLNDDDRFDNICSAIEKDQMVDVFGGRELAGLNYAKVLTLAHHNISEQDIEALRNSGFDDGEILEINQVVSYFNYVNRTVVGLGVDTEGDVLGLSPGEGGEEDWGHQ